MRETKAYLALDELCFKHPTKLIRGQVLDKRTTTWLPPTENERLPAEAIIRAGSVFEKSYGPSEEKKLMKLGCIAPASTTKHFDLEQVFGEERVDYGVEGSGDDPRTHQATLSEVLREHGIHTIEQVAENAMGTVPAVRLGTIGAAVSVADVLEAVLPIPEQAQEYIERAKEILQEGT